jgi:urease accessory protein
MAIITPMTTIMAMSTAIITSTMPVTTITTTITGTSMATGTTIRTSDADTLPLMAWLSPTFPAGAFAYSHGLEWAHKAGDLADAAALRDWLAALIEHGAMRNDAILLAAGHRAALAGDRTRLGDIAELALAMATSRERRLETATQGSAFLRAICDAWPDEALERLRGTATSDIAYPVAVAMAAASHGLPLGPTLSAFLLGAVSSLVSAAIRLGVVGQTDGQRVIAALMHAIRQAAALAENATLDDLGGCVFRSDLAALRHETQYTRLFRS